MVEKQQHSDENDGMLEGLFEAAKVQDLMPSDALMARVLQDAAREQPVLAPFEAKKPGLMPLLWGTLGGWPAMAGLATATVAGVWMGIYPNDYVMDVVAQYTGAESDYYLADTFSVYNFDLEEG